jgi:hypothetical protein
MPLDSGLSPEFPTALASRIASRFALANPVEAYEFPDKGNINLQTFLIFAGVDAGPDRTSGEFILQRINDRVFTNPRSVMSAMIACLDAQRRGLLRRPLPPGVEWEPISLVSTRDGSEYLENEDRRGTTHWRLMVRIPECRTFKSLGELPERADRLKIAEEAGRGLALFGDLTADMDTTGLASPLPGYRDTRVYYDQLESVVRGHRSLLDAEPFLPIDPVVRQSTQHHFYVHASKAEHERRLADPEIRALVELARAERDFAMTLLDALESGRIRRVAIHGDTKLENFLFALDAMRVKALVDLDTILPQSWLADWGDMVRSLVNVAGEKERDPAKVGVDLEIYAAVARGFLATATAVTAEEILLMVDAVEIITLELGVRFLADYIRGDSYFRLGPADPPDLNRVRARVQLTLFRELRACAPRLRALVSQLAEDRGASR